MSPEELAEIVRRDEDAECVAPSCHQTAADRRALLAELNRLHSWDGLMELLNEHWPEWLFVTAPDPEDYHEPLYYLRPDTRRGRGGADVPVRANPGVIITGLIRWVDRLRKQAERP